MLSTARELEAVDYTDPEFGIENSEAQTNYEIKYLREGRRIYQLAYQKR
jgi:hypothetical protein